MAGDGVVDLVDVLRLNPGTGGDRCPPNPWGKRGMDPAGTAGKRQKPCGVEKDPAWNPKSPTQIHRSSGRGNSEKRKHHFCRAAAAASICSALFSYFLLVEARPKERKSVAPQQKKRKTRTAQAPKSTQKTSLATRLIRGRHACARRKLWASKNLAWNWKNASSVEPSSFSTGSGFVCMVSCSNEFPPASDQRRGLKNELWAAFNFNGQADYQRLWIRLMKEIQPNKWICIVIGKTSIPGSNPCVQFMSQEAYLFRASFLTYTYSLYSHFFSACTCPCPCLSAPCWAQAFGLDGRGLQDILRLLRCHLRRAPLRCRAARRGGWKTSFCCEAIPELEEIIENRAMPPRMLAIPESGVNTRKPRARSNKSPFSTQHAQHPVVIKESSHMEMCQPELLGQPECASNPELLGP